MKFLLGDKEPEISQKMSTMCLSCLPSKVNKTSVLTQTFLIDKQDDHCWTSVSLSVTSDEIHHPYTDWQSHCTSPLASVYEALPAILSTTWKQAADIRSTDSSHWLIGRSGGPRPRHARSLTTKAGDEQTKHGWVVTSPAPAFRHSAVSNGHWSGRRSWHQHSE